ncbi:hypothetical protein [Hymenobacter sp. GOD-10R]|uniref:hypothetical protein n=1 Tax=Hymenobacter sp. GOD-10R TaxID=3093922 RepID=UPI002D78D4EB|nr:hypothetical protein [Hymenobacter sp. GOD-10R]WRQ26452.1 hypothetical protein SD425_15330 [Hymenobacter sp. GOD-10R]
MVHSFLFAPFSDPARQEQFEAVENALRTDASAPTTLLLGNLGATDAPPVDAVLLQPGKIVLLMLVPQSGHLRIPALEYGTWRLSDQPIAGFGEADNPFDFYQHQKDSVLEWLGVQLDLAPTALPPLAGFVVLLAPVTYGPEVENQLSRQTAAYNFQLVNDARQMPRRLRQLAPLGDAPAEANLNEWAAQLRDQFLTAEPAFSDADEEPSYGFWEQSARRLWLWLGAADVPADPPYSTASDPRQLEALRRELQTELRQQQQAAQARETAREQELTHLRQQLAQTPNHQLAAQQERAELEEALRVARTESATRNQELDARIQQLGQLIEQLRTQATTPTPAVVKQPSPVAAQPKIPSPRSVRKPAPVALPTKLNLTRVAMALGVLLCLGVGSWALVRFSKHYLAARKPRREQAARIARPAESSSPQDYLDSENFTSQTVDSTSEHAEAPGPDESLIVQDEPPVVNDPKLIMQVASDSAVKAVEQEENPESDSITQ